ncbi:MAG: 4,5-DOPA dioxygenase extradiol [Eubacteriales bacterium]|nr:4,5-DOPA dioxygenase extradiol [Eubacteriales bacterium]MDD4134627.1 4,5-DOPA dioxygenase extradiol [Eubacteriales bacterium]
MQANQRRMPLLFVGHGSPMNALEDNAWTEAWNALGRELPRPTAVLCLSAHFAGSKSLVVNVPEPEIIHDFYGFPKALFDVRYPAPGSPLLARRVTELFGEAEETDRWGLDHGAWSVLTHMYPRADIPAVQLSLDLSLRGEEQMAIGRKLQPLRDEGVLILGSGNVAHNLRRINPRMREPFPWARDFDEAVYARIMAGDYQGIADYMALPGAEESVPTTEHFVPLPYILGAADKGEKAQVINRDYVFASLSMTGYLIGA